MIAPFGATLGYPDFTFVLSAVLSIATHKACMSRDSIGSVFNSCSYFEQKLASDLP